ncbi:WXG100 family type VII secretion target [Lacrimispora sp. BS-2]|uniref:WXG100 family type VII secretion target n=1 Tax=Lacrimispora sp. BS-2 TaxID=3151850 RepID=A0AAU7PJI2_9FIRM
MSSRRTIEFDFRLAKQKANELDEIAENLQNLSNNKFNNTMQNLSAGWKGESASLYLNKGQILQEDIIKTSKNLREVASTIRAVAKRIYEAEMEALRIAEERDN